MLAERLGNSGKSLYEMSIMSYQAKEGPNLSVSLWRSIFSDGLHIDVAGLNAFFRHLVSQVIYFLPEQITLLRFQL